MKTKKLTSRWIYELEDEYRPDTGIYCEDSETIASLKRIISSDLDETERRIILAYAEIGNLRETAKLFKVSTTTIHKEIKKIREKIKKCLNYCTSQS